MVQSTKCLPHKHQDQSSVPRSHVKRLSWGHMFTIPPWKQTNPEAYWPPSLLDHEVSLQEGERRDSVSNNKMNGS